jgi:hypothetical protein
LAGNSHHTNPKARKPKPFVMKKKALVAAALVTASVVSAQTGEITSNRGENWLSQDGDWGLTFDASPMLNYVGNLFNGTIGNGGASLTWANPMFAIQGKKLVDANTAYRGKLRLGIGSSSVTKLEASDFGYGDSTFTQKVGGTNIVLGAGLEKRVGSTRVVGVYGAEAYVALGSGKTTHEFDKALSNTNAATRVTEVKAGSTFGVGVGVFGGVEWFAAPKLSISGEYTWGLMLASTGASSTTIENWTGTAVNSTTSEGGKTSNFGLDTGVSGVSLGINFYFQ